MRIDDTDAQRNQAQFIGALQEDLNWLGLSVDLMISQSSRMGFYRKAAESLKKNGLLYPCFETSEELKKMRKLHAGKGPRRYDRSALKLSDEQREAFLREGRKPYWRFKLSGQRVCWDDLTGKRSYATKSLSDPVLVRADGSPTFLLTGAVDDLDLGITQVVRGEDHVTNTAVQIEIMRALDPKAVLPSFCSVPLLSGAEGKLFSKRFGGGSIRELRQKGFEPQALCAWLLSLGRPASLPVFESLTDLFCELSLQEYSGASPSVDWRALEVKNADYVRAWGFKKFSEKMKAAGIGGVSEEFWEVVRPNLETLQEAVQWSHILLGDGFSAHQDFSATQRLFVSSLVDSMPDSLNGPNDFSQWLLAAQEKAGFVKKEALKTLRLALTGRTYGPRLPDLISLMGCVRVTERLKNA